MNEPSAPDTPTPAATPAAADPSPPVESTQAHHDTPAGGDDEAWVESPETDAETLATDAPPPISAPADPSPVESTQAHQDTAGGDANSPEARPTVAPESVGELRHEIRTLHQMEDTLQEMLDYLGTLPEQEDNSLRGRVRTHLMRARDFLKQDLKYCRDQLAKSAAQRLDGMLEETPDGEQVGTAGAAQG